jgi:hypothetical protein
MVPQPFAAGENRSYSELWVVTSDLRYPGYFTSTIVPEPTIEWVVGASHSIVGRIGSHMVLWAILWDSKVRLQG